MLVAFCVPSCVVGMYILGTRCVAVMGTSCLEGMYDFWGTHPFWTPVCSRCVHFLSSASIPPNADLIFEIEVLKVEK